VSSSWSRGCAIIWASRRQDSTRYLKSNARVSTCIRQLKYSRAQTLRLRARNRVACCVLCQKAVHLLSLSFKPLFALRIDFRECETFFLGTARAMGGNSSRSGASKDGNAKELGHVNMGRAIRRRTSWRTRVRGSLLCSKKGASASRATLLNVL
jgi:hypothetical protein